MSRYNLYKQQGISPHIVNLLTGTCAVSRHNSDRYEEVVKLQRCLCGVMRVSGYNYQRKAVLGAGAKAKTVTSKCTLLSVLQVVIIKKDLAWQIVNLL